MTEKRWTAMYYPYADFRKPDFILRAALFFDEIFFLQPGFFWSPSLSSEETGKEDWPQIAPELKPLHEQDIIRDVDIDLLGISHGWMGNGSQVIDDENRCLLIENIKTDSQNEELQKLGQENNKLAWAFPNLQFIGMAALGLLFEASLDLGKSIGVQYNSRLSSSLKNYAGVVELGPASVERRLSQRRGEGDVVLVPFHIGQSLMINIAMLASSRLTTIPITDSSLHQEFLFRKIANIYNDNEVMDWVQANLANSTSQLARQAINIALPHVRQMTADDVLLIRDKCFGELQEFRQEMALLASKMQYAPWEYQFEQEITDILHSDIEPKIRALEKEMRILQRDIKSEVITKGSGLAPLSMATSVLGLPIDAALAAGVGTESLTQLAKYWQKKKEIKSNGISYLLNFTS